MAVSKECFTFIWKIKNFSWDFKKKIFSPNFLVHSLNETTYRLELYPNSSSFPGCVAAYLDRCVDNSEPLELDYELSFLDGDGSALHSGVAYKENIPAQGSASKATYIKRDEVLKKDVFIPADTLTIRCRIWNSQESITQSGMCYAETRFQTECKTFVGHIKKFSSIEPNSQNLISIKSSSTVSFVSSMSLCAATDGKLFIEVKPLNQKPLLIYGCKIFFSDIFGNKIKSGKGEFHDNETHTIPLTVLKEHVLENKRYYLLNDVLTLDFEFTFSTGEKTEKICEPEYGIDFQNNQEIVPNPKKTTNSTSKEYHTESLTTLMDDLNSLFSEGLFYDKELKTATETFPAHAVVLAARSSVFKSMFSTDMKEKSNNCINIDDLDADTVRQMLLFMYTDEIEDPEYENVRNLYFAADKYNIVSLRHRCASVLKQNFLQSNYFEILLLADRHQDNDLKNAVQDYVIKNDETVLFSDEWKNLEKNNSKLTTEVMRNMYLKYRRISESTVT